jgi:hypothetical protein
VGPTTRASSETDLGDGQPLCPQDREG